MWMNDDIAPFSAVLHGLLNVTSETLQCCTACLKTSLVCSWSRDRHQHFLSVQCRKYIALRQPESTVSAIWNRIILLCGKLKIWNRESKIWNLASEIWNTVSGIWNLRNEIWGLKSEIWNSKSGIWILESEISNLPCETWKLKTETSWLGLRW